MTTRIFATGVSLALMACALDQPAPDSAAAPRICSVIDCPGNAASAGDGLIFDEVHLGGLANYAGVRMTGAHVPGVGPVAIDIRGHELVAVGGGITYRHAALLGIEMHFAHDDGETFDVQIAGIDENFAHFVTGPDVAIPVYDLRARRAGSTKFDYRVCNRESAPVDPTWSIAARHHAVVYRGDRYAPEQKKVVANDPASGWSFIGCNGSAASKLHLFRHTFAGGLVDSRDPLSGPSPMMTTTAERTALYKAIVADYCGTGRSFTVDGTPLVWATRKDPDAWPFPYAGVDVPEAIFTGAGAACLDQPRLIKRAKIEYQCGRTFPRCTGGATGQFPAGWQSVGHVVTANPLLP